MQKLVDMDEGSHSSVRSRSFRIESPISQSNILFYNTLFDENASNHLAIGSGYAFNIEGGKTMSPEELEASGVNASITHNDFMIGSAEMDIDGIRRTARSCRSSAAATGHSNRSAQTKDRKRALRLSTVLFFAVCRMFIPAS